MKKEHIKWASFHCFTIFIFTKLAQADKLNPAACARLVPIREVVVQRSGLYETAEVIIRFIFILLLF